MRASIPWLEPMDAASGCLLWRLELWRHSGQQNPLGKGLWDGQHYVWCMLLLVLLFPGSSRWSRPMRPLWAASKVRLAPVCAISRSSILHPTLSPPSFPFPGLDFLIQDLNFKGQELGLLSLFPPALLIPLESLETLVHEKNLHFIPTSHRQPCCGWSSTLWRGAELQGWACMPSRHSCCSKTKQK